MNEVYGVEHFGLFWSLMILINLKFLSPSWSHDGCLPATRVGWTLQGLYFFDEDQRDLFHASRDAYQASKVNKKQRYIHIISIYSCQWGDAKIRIYTFIKCLQYVMWIWVWICITSTYASSPSHHWRTVLVMFFLLCVCVWCRVIVW